MDIRLNANSEQILREQMSRGNFHSPEEVIESALHVLATSSASQTSPSAVSVSTTPRSPEQFAAFLDGLAALSDAIPPMPQETFSREMIYQSRP